MKKYLSGSAVGTILGAAMLLPLAAAPAAAQLPGGSYLQTCRDVHMRGDRLVATCRTRDGDWTRTSLNNADRCHGGIANMDGRLTCGGRGGGRDYGRGDWRDDRRNYGGYRDGYGSGYGQGYDAWGRWHGR